MRAGGDNGDNDGAHSTQVRTCVGADYNRRTR